MAVAKEIFENTLSVARSFDGMMIDLSVALFYCLMSHQKVKDISGNMIEFGVYRGKSASVLLSQLQPDEQLMLVDVADYPELDKLRKVSEQFTFIKDKSENLAGDKRIKKFLKDGVRVSHHDASHTFLNLTSELELIDKSVKPGGMVILDDFGNWHYAQVVAAFFHHVYKKTSDLEIFMIAANKAYVCRRDDFPMYHNYVVNGILADLKEIGFDCYIGRTDKRDTFRGFYLNAKRNAGDDDFYGLKTFGDQFYRPMAE